MLCILKVKIIWLYIFVWKNFVLQTIVNGPIEKYIVSFKYENKFMGPLDTCDKVSFLYMTKCYKSCIF